MAQGMVPARGNWEYRTFPKSQLTTLAQGQFIQGDLVGLDHGRHLSVYTSTQSNWLGIGLHNSLNSALGVTIAIPAPNCTAYVDSITSEVASSLSLGQAGSIYSRYGHTSVLTMQPGGPASAFSYVATVVGPIDTTQSRIEIAFIQSGAIFYSASSATLNN